MVEGLCLTTRVGRAGCYFEQRTIHFDVICPIFCDVLTLIIALDEHDQRDAGLPVVRE
jgi:hypothetical protein